MAPTVLLIDNYDSFVFNLSRYLQELGVETIVRRNDSISTHEIEELNSSAIVISPGPCTPNEAGISVELVQNFYRKLPILGVCLGHQAIAQALGGKVIRAPEPFHGRTSTLTHAGDGLFTGCVNPLSVCRYHSLIVEEATLPSELDVTSCTEDGLIMSFRHRSQPVFGVQFHPESILTQFGHVLMANFLRLAGIEFDADLADLGDLSTPKNLPDDFYQRQIDSNAQRPL